MYCSDYRAKKKKKNENAEGCVRSCLASRSERIIATRYFIDIGGSDRVEMEEKGSFGWRFHDEVKVSRDNVRAF